MTQAAMNKLQTLLMALVLLNFCGWIPVTSIFTTPYPQSSACPNGTLGARCDDICSNNCAGSGNCSSIDGTCTEGCNDGYTGLMCNEACPNGTFGAMCNGTCSKNCAGSEPCSSTNGTCSNGCKDGYTGSMCNEACPNGTFGAMCNGACSKNCAGSESCSPTGTCTKGCKDGYTGVMCNEACAKGYGPNCKFSCNENCKVDDSLDPKICHFITGACLLGCQNGYHGFLCNEKSIYGISELAFAVIITVAAAVVIILIVIIIACCCIRRSRSHKSMKIEQYDSITAGVPDLHMYQSVKKPDKIVKTTETCIVMSQMTESDGPPENNECGSKGNTSFRTKEYNLYEPLSDTNVSQNRLFKASSKNVVYEPPDVCDNLNDTQSYVTDGEGVSQKQLLCISPEKGVYEQPDMCDSLSDTQIDGTECEDTNVSYKQLFDVSPDNRVYEQADVCDNLNDTQTQSDVTYCEDTNVTYKQLFDTTSDNGIYEQPDMCDNLKDTQRDVTGHDSVYMNMRF